MAAFDRSELFDGCLPIEEIAASGPRTLAFGPLRTIDEDAILAADHVVDLEGPDDEGMWTLKNGSDSFSYKATDGTRNSNVATVSITITPVNDNLPVADNETFTVALSNAQGAAIVTGQGIG